METYQGGEGGEYSEEVATRKAGGNGMRALRRIAF